MSTTMATPPHPGPSGTPLFHQDYDSQPMEGISSGVVEVDVDPTTSTDDDESSRTSLFQNVKPLTQKSKKLPAIIPGPDSDEDSDMSSKSDSSSSDDSDSSDEESDQDGEDTNMDADDEDEPHEVEVEVEDDALSYRNDSPPVTIEGVRKIVNDAFERGFAKMTNTIDQFHADMQEKESDTAHSEWQGTSGSRQQGRGGIEKRPRGHKPNGQPKRRSSFKNDLSAQVRKRVKKVLNGRPSKHMVKKSEIKKFEDEWNADPGNCKPPCNIKNFRVDTRGRPKSPWNRSISHVFCDFFIPKFIRKFPKHEKKITRRLVYAAFFTHLRTIRDGVRKALSTVQAANLQKQKQRRANRKRALFRRRLRIATKVQGLQNHIEILERLGVEGMSSDESDSGAPEADPVYTVVLPSWRSKHVALWLHVFDTMHLLARKNTGDAVINPGAKPRIRNYNPATAKFSTSHRYRPGLPMNAYREEWLAARLDAEWGVEPTGNYEFKHENEIIHYITASAEANDG